MPDFEKNIRGLEEPLWLRPVTTRRYLHPPRAQRMATLWAEGKIILGENVKGKDFTSYPDLTSFGVWPVYSKRARKFDFRKTENVLPEDGTPIHGLKNAFYGFDVEMEAFCDTAPLCTVFCKITVTCKAPYRSTGRFGLAVRTGKEEVLAFGSPDGYSSYDPELGAFLAVPATWKEEGSLLTDGEAYLLAKSDLDLSFEKEAGILWADFVLEPEEKTEIFFAFGKGAAADFDYEKEREKSADYWEKELSRLQTEDRTIKNLAVQILQSFCSYVGEEDLVLRQGGLQRLIWPWEAMPALEALARIGDFSEEIEGVLSFYFDKMQQEDGEVKTVGEGWASVTASCLYSLATYALQKGDRDYFARYEEKAFRTFDWIVRKRKESEGVEGAVAGLFPPMRGCDWPQQFQHWTNTDVFAYFALSALAKTAEHFGSARAEEVKRESRDYLACLTRLFSAWSEKHRGEEELRVPLTPDGNDALLLDAFHPYLLQGAFVRTGAVKETDIDRILRYHKRVGLLERGLHSRMPYRDGSSHIFYTCNGDFHWFYTYLALGRVKEAKEVLEATLTYSMTKEYYMIERYHALDPYYVPWSPNVSASGRTILMLLDING